MNFSLEIGPKTDLSTLPKVKDVYVTMLPGGDYRETADKAVELVKKGFNPDGKQLFIDPEECIDCGACEPECPVEAIFEESEVPKEWDKYIKKNYEHFGQTAPE